MVLPEVRCMCVIALDVTRGLMSRMLWPGRSVKRGRARRRISGCGVYGNKLHTNMQPCWAFSTQTCMHDRCSASRVSGKMPGVYRPLRACVYVSGGRDATLVSAIPQAPASGGRLRLQRPSVCHSCDFIPHARPQLPCGNTLDKLSAMLWGTTMSDAYTCAHHQHPYILQ